MSDASDATRRRRPRAATAPANASARPPGWLRPSLPVALCVLLVSVISWMRVPLLPEMGEDLQMAPSTLGWVVTAFGVGRLLMDMPAGRLVDRVPPLRLFALAALMLSLASLGMAVAQLPIVVIVACMLLGIGSATSNTTGMATMAGRATQGRRGSAMALYSGALLIGQALGPTLGGMLSSVQGWRLALLCGSGLALLLAAGAATAARRSAGRPAGTQRSPVPASGAPFSRVQHLVVFAVGFSVFFTVSSMPQVLVPLMGADELGLTTVAIGLALGAGGVARFIGALSTGVVSDRFSRKMALLPCLALQASGVAIIAVADSVTWWLVALVTMSLGSSGQGVCATMLGDRSDPKELGRVLGRYRFAGDIGLVSGPVLVALAYQHAGPTVAALGTCAVLLAALVTAALLLPETAPRQVDAA
ncbi:MAG TPA: MFS transporter [Nocardioidaceae bacterium]|nr:MFS transporter [Nocardioidaceae bacterium]